MQETRTERRIRQRTEENARRRSSGPAEPARRIASKTQLELLHGREAISIAQRNAGERLYKDYHLSGAEPVTTGSMEPSLGVAVRGMTDVQAEASSRYRQALQAVGVALSDVLVAVCLLDEPAGDWAQNKGLPRPDGPARLRLALDLLRDHYDGNADNYGRPEMMVREK